MRVQFKQRNNIGITVIEAIEMKRLNNQCLGLVLPYSKRLEKLEYDTFESTTPIDETEFIRWCEQLLRTGYLDLTRTELEFKATHAT